MQRLACVVSFLLLLPCVTSAQADGWVPPAHARRGGNDGFAMPGNWSEGRSQAILDQADLPPGLIPGRVLTKIAYRRSVLATSISTTFAAKTLMAEVLVGNSTLAASRMTRLFAGNRPADLSVVLPLSILNLPTDPPLGAFREIGADTMVFPFTTPKLFTGPHLFIEHVNNMPPSVATEYWSDALDNGAARPYGHNTLRGEFGCGGPFRPTTLRPNHVISNNQPGTATGYGLAAATPSTSFLLAIGFQLERPYGIPVPFDLAPAGAPSCPFWNSVDVVLVGSTLANGAAGIAVGWPNDQSIAGLEVGMQALVSSPSANAAGLTTSNGISAWIGARYPLVSSTVLVESVISLVGILYLGGTQITHLFWT